MNILFVGDIMPGGVLPYQNKYIDDNLLSYLQSFDLRVGTLECGVGTDIPFDEAKMANTMGIVYVRNEDLFRLKEMNINVVTLANNHTFDLGLEGLDNAQQQLDAMGIKCCGAGHNIEEAGKPAVVKFYNKTFAFIGCMIDVPSPRMFHRATSTDYGVYQVSIDVLEGHIKAIKQKYDYVFILPHWGEEHSYCPPVYCKECAQRMIDAGADAIIGSHPHVINPMTAYKGKPIYFSLGNFLFPDKCMQVPRPMYYPNSCEDYESLKRVWTYPYRIKENVVAVWKPKNRIGMMVEMNVKEKLKTHYNLTCLTADNVLHCYSSRLVRFRMIFWALLIHSSKYGFVRRLYNHRYNLFRRFVEKFPAFSIPVKL